MIIYNFKNKIVQRVIEIQILTGITKNLNAGSIEFIIHVKDEADIRLDYEDRDYMIELIRKNFEELSGKSLPVYGTSKGKTLKDYETT